MQAGEVAGDNPADIFGKGVSLYFGLLHRLGGHVWSAYESGQGILWGLFIVHIDYSCIHLILGLHSLFARGMVVDLVIIFGELHGYYIRAIKYFKLSYTG
jgi:hypothetical protein